jgi:DNA-binding transcriptional MerR regulator
MLQVDQLYNLDIFDKDKLFTTALEKAEAYKKAEPFPHIVLDNLFSPQGLETVLAHFPAPDYVEWNQQQDKPFQPRKQGRLDVDVLPASLRYILYQFNSKPMLQFLEKLTGIGGLIPDAYFFGGGLHQILPGGFLEVHTDFNKHPLNGLNRRLNLLVYLNKEWEDAYNGHLELWQPDMTKCVKKIAPVFNRTVVFSTTEISFHGHPEILKCPENMTRKSMAFYYYTHEPDQNDVAFRTTNWQSRPNGKSRYIDEDFQEKLNQIASLEATLKERDMQIHDLQTGLQTANQKYQELSQQQQELLQQIQQLQGWATTMEKELQSRPKSGSNILKKFLK